ncbi:MAG: hypothetical protein SOU51_00410 [Collinsella sp.]|nr:hypothetical protein [Collinsella sp.]
MGMLFCLPSRLGGFDLGDLSFNVGFRVYDGMDRDGNPRSRIRVPDILIASPGDGESRRLAAIDYDPDSTHAGEGKIIADQRRRNEIATITSLPHFTITSDDARDFSYLCSLAERVRKVLGRPLRPSLRQAIGAYESQRKLNEAMYRRSMLWRGLVLPPFEGALTGSHRLFE